MAILGDTKAVSLTLLDGVIGNLVPKATDLYDLGTSTLKWRNIYGTFKGNADTATVLKTARTIWGQNFDGSGNITGGMVNVGPQIKLPSGQTTFAFYTSVGGAANITAGRLGLNSNFSNVDLTNYVLDVSGKVRIKLSNTTTNSKEFIITGSNNNYISLYTSGIQAYNSDNNTSLFYLQYYGGDLQIGSSDTATATRVLHGKFDFKSATGFNFSGISAASDNAARYIWFSYNGQKGTPVYDEDFKFNPSTNTLSIGTGTLTATNYSGNAATATNATTATKAFYLLTPSITTETDIESETRAYQGSGSEWTGSISSMQYAGILQVCGGFSRGWQIWARRGDNNSESLHWRNPNNAATAWNTERIILDTGNTTAPSTIPTLAWGTESTVFTLNGTAVKIKAMSSPTWSEVQSKPATATRWPKWNEIGEGSDALLAQGPSEVTANTEILTSYASDNGFSDSNAPGKVYRRAASKIVNATLVKAALGTGTGTTKFLREDGTWSNILKQTSGATLGIDSNAKIGTAIKDLHFSLGTGTGTGIDDGTAGGITFGTDTASYGGIYWQTSSSYGSRIHFATTGNFTNGARTRMIITHDGKIGIGTLSPDTLLTVNGNAKATKFIGALQGNADTATSANTAKHASAAHWSTTGGGSNSGIIKIKIKKKTSWMLAFTVRVYQGYVYDDYVISGYNDGSSNWYRADATLISSKSSEKHTVTFGYDDDAVSNYKTLWVSIPIKQYTGIDIFNVTNGFTQIDIHDAFEIVQETTSTGTIQTTIDCYRPWYRNETVSDATTATNLSVKPSLAASGNNITVTAGGKTSDAFTVPYATSAGSATTATSLTDFVVSKYTIAAGKGVRITYPTQAPVLISVQTSLGGARLILIGGGYGAQATVRNDFTEIVSCSTRIFTWSLPDSSSISNSIEIMDLQTNIDGNVVVWSKAACTFTEITALTTAATNRTLLHSSNYSSYALPLSGGQMTGPLTWKDNTALPEKTSADYFLAIDAFTDGGKTYWVSKANVLNSIGAAPAVTGGYLPLSGGTMSGHIFMGGSNASSSTANTTQLVFGTSTTQHIAITSNDKALILNPSTSSTTNQIILYLNKKSKFPSGIEGDLTGDVTGNAATATAIQTAGTTAQFYRGDNSWSNIIKQTANTTLGIDTNLKIGTARKDLNFDIATGTGTGINDGYAGGITWGTGAAAHAGIYCQTSGSYGTRLIFGTTGSYANGAYARMIIQSNGYVGIGTLSPDTLLTVNGNAKATKFIGNLEGNAASATTAASADAVTWANVSGKPIEFGTYSGALNTNGWKTLGAKTSGAKIYIAYNNNPATWNSKTYSSSLVFGCEDTKGLLDISHDSPIVTFGGSSNSNSTDNDPKWYFKLSATSGQTYTFPTASKTLAAADGSNASGTWSINVSGTASKLTDISSSDAASSTAIWRRIWFSYENNTTGRPSYSDNFAYQTSTGTLKTTQQLIGNNVLLQYNSTDQSLDFVFA